MPEPIKVREKKNNVEKKREMEKRGKILPPPPMSSCHSVNGEVSMRSNPASMAGAGSVIQAVAGRVIQAVSYRPLWRQHDLCSIVSNKYMRMCDCVCWYVS